MGFPALGVSDSHCDLDKSSLESLLKQKQNTEMLFTPNTQEKHSQEGRKGSQKLKPPKYFLRDS